MANNSSLADAGIARERTAVPAEVDNAAAEAPPAALVPPAPDIQTSSDDEVRWPDDASEPTFVSQQVQLEQPIKSAARVEDKNSSAAVAESEGESVALPALQSLIDKIPAEARATLDELFRARFVSVKRVQKSVLND